MIYGLYPGTPTENAAAMMGATEKIRLSGSLHGDFGQLHIEIIPYNVKGIT